MQTSALALLVVALLAGAAGWWLGRRPDPRLVAQLDSLRVENAELDSAVQRHEAEGPAVHRVVVEATAGARKHDTTTVKLLKLVLVATPDTLVPVLERIQAEHVATVTSYEVALDSLTSRLQRSDSLLLRSEQLRAANLALAAAAVRHSRASLVVVTLGVGATYAGGRLAVGPTLAAGMRIPLFRL